MYDGGKVEKKKREYDILPFVVGFGSHESYQLPNQD